MEGWLTEAMDINEEEKTKLRDIAIRLAAAVGWHPDRVLEELILLILSGKVFPPDNLKG